MRQKEPIFTLVNLKGEPLSIESLEQKRHHLVATLRHYHHFIVGIFILGSSISYLTITLGYDTDERELLQMSLYVGLWLGLFTGLMINGNTLRRVKMVVISLLVSTSSSLFVAMLTTLMVGGLAPWISSMNILGGAMGCMWVLTYYDVATKAFESTAEVNEAQFSFIKKLGQRFPDINTFNYKIADLERIPTVGEFWAMEEWFTQNNANN